MRALHQSPAPDPRLFERLADSLEREVRALGALAKAMTEQRLAYLSLKPSELENAIGPLEAQRQSMQDLESERIAATKAVLTALQLPANAGLRRIIARAPVQLRARLSKVRTALQDATRAIQVESRVGTRLLEFSRRSTENLVQDIAGAMPKHTPSAYDRRGSAVAGAARSGSLISGTV